MKPAKIYDIIGIGIGPFNLGLAALAHSIPELNCLFIDKNDSFEWHPGLMLDGARLQVPFLADLVTLADPSSKFSCLCFLKAKNRLTRFAIHENYYPTRKEYNQYCQWVAAQLPSLRFSRECIGINYDDATKTYTVTAGNTIRDNIETFHGKHLVIGTGTVPAKPACAEAVVESLAFHSGEYLFKQEVLKDVNDITVIGSGQSAAEIFQHLLTTRPTLRKLSWFTRSPRFMPMENSKLSFEMSSPDYIDYFYHLQPHQKKKVLAGQDALYKKINTSLISDIYDALYLKSLDDNANLPKISAACELNSIEKKENRFTLAFTHVETDRAFTHQTGAVILATGYKQQAPAFLNGIRHRINWLSENHYNVKQDYSIDDCNTVFAQNADLHTHGFNSADLGLATHRNVIILHSILQNNIFQVEVNNSFQHFRIH